jgi:hypothetical protein
MILNVLILRNSSTTGSPFFSFITFVSCGAFCYSLLNKPVAQVFTFPNQDGFSIYYSMLCNNYIFRIRLIILPIYIA